MILHETIPQEKTAAATRALRESFGMEEVEDIRFITKGLSAALVYRIVVQGRPYLLRIIMRTGVMLNPEREYARTREGANAGLAPKVWYTSNEDGVSITDFVTSVPFPESEALVRIPGVLRRLHALPRFPPPASGNVLEKFVSRLQTGNILPKDEVEDVFARYAKLTAAYPQSDAENDPDLVSCHNDLKPENILFDGERVWLIDWEAAFLNDRYFDLAIVANFVVTNEAEERLYLEHYFEQQPSEYQLGRFFLMRQKMHMLYAATFLLLGSAGQPVDVRERPPEFREFHRRLWEREVALETSEMKVVYGRVHWEKLKENLPA